MNEQRPRVTDDGSRGARSATAEGSADSRLPPDQEVAATAKRRQFSSKEKRRILAAADRCTEAGAIGALLRREGIYSSQLATWRRQRAASARVALEPRKRGRKADPGIAESRQVAGLKVIDTLRGFSKDPPGGQSARNLVRLCSKRHPPLLAIHSAGRSHFCAGK
jgi:transposase-like protein